MPDPVLPVTDGVVPAFVSARHTATAPHASIADVSVLAGHCRRVACSDRSALDASGRDALHVSSRRRSTWFRSWRHATFMASRSRTAPETYSAALRTVVRTRYARVPPATNPAASSTCSASTSSDSDRSATVRLTFASRSIDRVDSVLSSMITRYLANPASEKSQ